MRVISRRLTVCVIVLCTCVAGFAVTVTYSAESPIYPKKSPGIFTHPTVFNAKLGRLSITGDTPMRNPTIFMTGVDSSYNVVLIGPHPWYEQGAWEYEKEINMNILTIKRLISNADFEQPDACISGIDYHSGRVQNRTLVSLLAIDEEIFPSMDSLVKNESLLISWYFPKTKSVNIV